MVYRRINWHPFILRYFWGQGRGDRGERDRETRQRAEIPGSKVRRTRTSECARTDASDRGLLLPTPDCVLIHRRLVTSSRLASPPTAFRNGSLPSRKREPPRHCSIAAVDSRTTRAAPRLWCCDNTAEGVRGRRIDDDKEGGQRWSENREALSAAHPPRAPK